MGFAFSRRYVVEVIFGAPAAEPLWRRRTWARVVPALDPLMVSPRGPAVVRTLQYGPDGKPLPFGRLGWDAASHLRWTQAGATRFGSTECWAPSAQRCARDDRPPDVYLSIADPEGNITREVAFRPLVLLAVAADLGAPPVAAGRTAAREIARVTRALLHVRAERPWGRRSGPDAFTDAIQDLPLGRWFRRQPAQGDRLTAGALIGRWTAVR